MSYLDRPAELRRRLEGSLLESIMPFWDRHAIDSEYGGILTGLDRRGKVVETDKSIWFQGRAAWVYARLAGSRLGTEEDRERWRRSAENALRFLERFGFDPAAGRYRYRVTRDGQPLITRRYRFSDCFACLGHAAYARSTGSESSLATARQIYRRLWWYRQAPEPLDPKVSVATRPTRGFALPMILINVAQEMRRADPARAEEYSRHVDVLTEELRLFLDSERRCVREQVNPDGSPQDHFEGRTLNPGHAIEGAWFVLEEARHRKRDAELLQLGLTMLDWMWEWGWDAEYGGIIHFRDAGGHDSPEYWHDMKFWWPQCEALLATQYAYAASGEPSYAERHARLLDWTLEHFPDPEHGEWFGYLHRDGSVSSSLKGTLFKGPYHVPRMHLVALDLLDGDSG